MSQLNYDVNFEKAFEGLLGDVNNIDSVSRLVEGAGVLFGRGVQSGTDEEQAKAADAAMTLAMFEGFVIHQSVENGELLEKYAVSVLRKGRIWVKSENAIAKDGSVFLRIQNGALGAVRADAVAGDTLDISSKVKVVKGTSGADELALLEINI